MSTFFLVCAPPRPPRPGRPGDNFFKYHPQGHFKMFDLAHILFIVLGILAIVVTCFCLRKLEKKKVEKILFVCAILGLIMDPLYWIWELIATGSLHFEKTLPLYFCSLFYMTLAVGVFCKNQEVKKICYSYLATMNIIAGLMGLIFNTNLNMWPVFSFPGLRTLIFHLLMLFVSCLIWFTEYYKPEIRDLYRFFIPIVILFVPAIIVDKAFGFDYCYLNGGKGTPVVENVSAVMPNAAFIIVMYLVLYAALIVLFYIPTIVRYIICRVKDKKAEKSETDLQA